MNASPLAPTFALVLAFLGASFGCGASNAESASVASAESASDADAGEPTCEDRARVAPICVKALTERCQSQSNDCEITCDSREDLPANGRKMPTERSDRPVNACRQDCRGRLDGCMRTLVGQCPRPCE
jgi:hypothetical protein